MDLQRVMREAVAPKPTVPRHIVIIGAGGIVREAHLPAYKKAGFPVAAVVDVSREKADRLAKDFNIPSAGTSIAEAIQYAPRNAVFDLAVPAKVIPSILPQLPDGAAVLIQKPMGDTL